MIDARRSRVPRQCGGKTSLTLPLAAGNATVRSSTPVALTSEVATVRDRAYALVPHTRFRLANGGTR
jgi:hypothetical protein